MDSGKNYYAPKDKAKVLSDGIKAMLCIHDKAVGIDGPTREAISEVQKNSGTSTDTGGKTARTPTFLSPSKVVEIPSRLRPIGGTST